MAIERLLHHEVNLIREVFRDDAKRQTEDSVLGEPGAGFAEPLDGVHE